MAALAIVGPGSVHVHDQPDTVAVAARDLVDADEQRAATLVVVAAIPFQPRVTDGACAPLLGEPDDRVAHHTQLARTDQFTRAELACAVDRAVGRSVRSAGRGHRHRTGTWRRATAGLDARYRIR